MQRFFLRSLKSKLRTRKFRCRSHFPIHGVRWSILKEPKFFLRRLKSKLRTHFPFHGVRWSNPKEQSFFLRALKSELRRHFSFRRRSWSKEEGAKFFADLSWTKLREDFSNFGEAGESEQIKVNFALMFPKVYLQEYGNNRLEPEHADIRDVLKSRGIPCTLFTLKKLQRNQIPVNSETRIIGDHEVSRFVLKKLNIEPPSDSYPQSLHPWLGRKVWTTTVRKLLLESHQQELSGIFIKPRSKAKLFTGFVLQSNAGLSKLDGCAKDTELYVSQEVEWLAEYRVFVTDGKIVGVRIYSGDPIHSPDMNVVKQAIAAFEASNERTSAYGIDFGVLSNSSTALVEWNDGYSLGSYGLDKELYTDLILRRWEELTTQFLRNQACK